MAAIDAHSASDAAGSTQLAFIEADTKLSNSDGEASYVSRDDCHRSRKSPATNRQRDTVRNRHGNGYRNSDRH